MPPKSQAPTVFPRKCLSRSTFQFFFSAACPGLLKHQALERQVRNRSAGPAALTSQHRSLPIGRHTAFGAVVSTASSDWLVFLLLPLKLISIPRKEGARLPGGWHRSARRGAFTFPLLCRQEAEFRHRYREEHDSWSRHSAGVASRSSYQSTFWEGRLTFLTSSSSSLEVPASTLFHGHGAASRNATEGKGQKGNTAQQEQGTYFPNDFYSWRTPGLTFLLTGLRQACEGWATPDTAFPALPFLPP